MGKTESPNRVKVETSNQLDELAERCIKSKRPIMSDELPVMEYTLKCMNRLAGDLYYIRHGTILVFTQKEQCRMLRFYCLNTEMLKLETMWGLHNLKLYGENRTYALTGIMDTLQVSVLNNSYDDKSLEEQANNISNVTEYIKYIGKSGKYHMFGAHVMHKGTKYSCLGLVGREGGLFCDFICIEDGVFEDLAVFANGMGA